jgi:uncharacterized protein YneF (UPF0154 family)
MKPLIVFVSLVVGLLIGFYVGYRYDENYAQHLINKYQQEFVRVMKSSEGDQATEASRVIELIESGDRSNAVRILSRPVADYYQAYAVFAVTDRDRKLRTLIEQLASTNQVIADAIHHTNYIVQP